MKTLYLMRHGETYFNTIQKTQGWCDSPLTDRGIAQARQARQYFIDQDIRFDHAYSSTLGRAVDTLTIIAENYIDKISFSKDLRELSFGRFEGETTQIIPPLPFEDYFISFGGESEQQALERFNHKMLEIFKDTEGRHILVVSHGSVIREVSKHWSSCSDHPVEVLNKNGSLSIFDYQKEAFYLRDYLEELV